MYKLMFKNYECECENKTVDARRRRAGDGRRLVPSRRRSSRWRVLELRAGRGDGVPPARRGRRVPGRRRRRARRLKRAGADAQDGRRRPRSVVSQTRRRSWRRRQ